MRQRTGFPRLSVLTVTALVAVVTFAMNPLAASSQRSDLEDRKDGTSVVVGVGAGEEGWEPRVRAELAQAGHPSPEAVVQLLRERQQMLEWNYSHRQQSVSVNPPALIPVEPDRLDNDSSYVGCSVGQWGNALLDVYDPTSVVIYWTGLSLFPPFTYNSGPLFETCGSYACMFYTGHQGTVHFSHTVSATVDTDVEITSTWCGP
jgi:hypothetical protein